MYSIGLDISKSTINVYIPINELDIVINNNLKAISGLYSKLKRLYKKEVNKLVFVFEPTGTYSFTLTKFCANKNIHCFIVNPKKSSNFARAIGNRNKTDIEDIDLFYTAPIIEDSSHYVLGKGYVTWTYLDEYFNSNECRFVYNYKGEKYKRYQKLVDKKIKKGDQIDILINKFRHEIAYVKGNSAVTK